MTRRGLRGAGLMLAALALAACGDDKAADTSTTATTVAAVVRSAPATLAATTTVRPTTTIRSTTSAPPTVASTTTVPVTVPATVEVTTTTEPPTTTTAAPETTLAPETTVAPPPTTIVKSETLPRPISPPPPRSTEDHVEVGTIEIPKISVSKSLLEGISLNTLDKGPGHWPGTAMPGHLGNVVVAGHRTSKDRPFRHIDQLVPGDEVIFTTAEGRFVYTVTGTQIVLPDAMWIVGQSPEATATLFACHPVGSTRERIVVFLQLEA